MTRRDVGGVAALERLAFSRDAWPAHAFVELLSAFAQAKPPRGAMWVAVDPATDEILGYAGVEISALWGEVDIINIAVAPAHRRRGVGRLLLRRIVSLCRRRSVPVLWLRVRASNRGAQRFYRRMGFRLRGRFQGYYVDPEEAALIMAMDIGPA